MCEHPRACALLLGLTLLVPSVSVAADNGITKEDIKRLEINAYTEEMQMEMEKSVRSELKTTLDSTQPDIQVDIVADDSGAIAPPAVPELSSR